ncbi:MAG TPA: tetratricopeptide repeat protein [bacterium]|nr:tetratricopeptide repeat protein [bacterium]
MKQGNRVLTTLLFTDIVGSTELATDLGDRRWHDLLDSHHAIVRRELRRFRGREIDSVGDSFLAIFDGPERGIRCACAVRDAVRDLRIEIRAGLHSGEVETGDGTVRGIAVHLGARVAAVARPGEILVSSTVRDLVAGSGIQFEDRGVFTLKGVPEERRLFAVSDVPPEAASGLHRGAEPGPVRLFDQPPGRTTNLPLQLTSFIGRARELAEIQERIASSRQLTLTGTGGVGKTRLAIELASRVLAQFPDGVWMVDLSPLSDPARVPQAVASALGVQEETGRPLPEVLGDYLLSKRALLMLDNCEHLTAACAELVEYLLRRCPDIRVLATSREILGTTGELTYSVPSLSVPDPRQHPAPAEATDYEAVRLFVDRAGLGQPDFVLTAANAPAVLQICGRLDGIPLAIELAAARVKTLSVEDIASRLDDRFRLLTGGARTALPRHRTLRAAMDWSHDLLSDAERTLLRRLAVFAGGFTLDTTEAVCAGEGIDPDDVLDLLTRLVDKSLVTVDRSAQTRYRQLETIRQYSRERLVAAGEEDATLRRHRDFYLALAEEAEPQLHGPRQMEWLDRVAAEHDNARAALEWSLRQPEGEPGFRLAAAMSSFWHARGYLAEGREWLDRVLPRTADVSAKIRMRALLGAGRLAFAQDDFGLATSIFEQVVPLAREWGDRGILALTLGWLGHAAWHQGERAKGVALCEESVALARDVGDAWTTAIVLDEVSVVARHEGDRQRASSLLEQSLVLFREAGDIGEVALCLSRLGALATDRADYPRAASLIEEALNLQQMLGRRTASASSLNRLGLIALARGDWENAIGLCESAAVIADELGKKPTGARMRVNAGLALLAKGDLEHAGAIFERSLGVQRTYGDAEDLASATAALGILARYQGDYVQARRLLDQSMNMLQQTGGPAGTTAPLEQLGLPLHQPGLLALAEGEPEHAATILREALIQQQKRGDAQGIAGSLEGLAGAMLALGMPEHAVCLFGAAEALREAIGAPQWPVDRLAYEQELARARATLGDDAFGAAWSSGRGVSVDEAVRFALSTS